MKKQFRRLLALALALTIPFTTWTATGGIMGAAAAPQSDEPTADAFDSLREEFFEEAVSGARELGELETIIIPDEPGIVEFQRPPLYPLEFAESRSVRADIHADSAYAAEGYTWGPFNVGDTRKFRITRNGVDNGTEAIGELRGQGIHSNVWVVSDPSINPREADMTFVKAQQIATIIDGIYERMTDPATGFAPHAHVKAVTTSSALKFVGDIDDDGMVNFLLYDLSGSAGYFWMHDYYERSRMVDSNYLDVLHMSMNGLLSSPLYYYGTLAHEFQHMLFNMYFEIYTDLKDERYRWIDESLADLAKTYYLQAGAEMLTSGRLAQAARNPYAGATNPYSDFVNFGAVKGYGVGSALSLLMYKYTGGSYAHDLYAYFQREFPTSANSAEYSRNRSKLSGLTMAEAWGNAMSGSGLIPGTSGGRDAFDSLYRLFMEALAADGGTIHSASDIPTIKLFAGTDSSENLWSNRNLDPYMLNSGGVISLGGYGVGAPKAEATHEMFYKLVPGAVGNTVLKITVTDASAGSDTRYYVALKRPGDLPNADIYPLTPGTEREIATNGKEAYLYAATAYRQVSGTVDYSWFAPAAGTLSGTVTLDNYKPNAGQALTATVAAQGGAYSYAWTSGGNAVGNNSNTYTTTASDIGKIIKVVVTSSAYSGSIETQTVATSKTAGPAAPAAPTLSSASYNSISLNAAAGYEYSMDSYLWQDEATFRNLLPLTSYTFYQRIKATGTRQNSNSSPGADFSTIRENRELAVIAPVFTPAVYGTRPAAQAIVMTNTGNSTVRISGVTLSGTNADAFEIGGGGTEVAAGADIQTWTIQPKAGLDAGTYTAAVNVAYNALGTGTSPATQNVTFIVNQAPLPAIVFPRASAITWGQALSASVLSGGSAGLGSFAWTTPTVLPAITNNGYDVMFTPSASTLKNYISAAPITDIVAITVNRAAAPAITFPAASAITYTQTLASSVLTGGTAGYGTFAWTNSGIVPASGTKGYSVTFTPNADTVAHYQPISPLTRDVSVTVNKAALGGTAAINGSAVYGARLSVSAAGLSSFPSIADLGRISYQWKRNGVDIITATGETYPLAVDDVGKVISVEVTADNCSGSVISGATAAVAKGVQSAPAVQTGITADNGQTYTYTVNISPAASNALFKQDNGEWQPGNVFGGIVPGDGVTHVFYAKYGETAAYYESPEVSTGAVAFPKLKTPDPIPSNPGSGSGSPGSGSGSPGSGSSGSSSGSSGLPAGSLSTSPAATKIDPLPSAGTIYASKGSVKVEYVKKGDIAGLSLTEGKITEIIKAAGNKTADFDLKEANGINGADLPISAISALNKAELNIRVDLPLAAITFGRSASKDIAAKAKTKNIAISAKLTAEETLNAAQKAAVGERPVYDLQVVDGEALIKTFGGSVEVSLPYALKANENSNGLVVYFVDDAGNKQIVKNSLYEDGRIVFTTTHFSLYMVGHNFVTFKDIERKWAENAVSWAASHELLSGYGDGTFRPNGSITRAEFTQIIYNALNLPQNRSAAPVYRDVVFGEWFYNAASAAKQAGLLNGLAGADNMLYPNQLITRQEVALVLANVAAYKKAVVTNEIRAAKFVDFGDIGSEYVGAVETAINMGFLNADGMGGGLFSPGSTVTRAQAAQIQANLLKVLRAPD